MPAHLVDLDPLDLPDWLGTEEVTWSARGGIRATHRVPGMLSAGPGEAGEHDDRRLACDLLAVDQAHPAPVAETPVRVRAHHAWRHGQVLVVHDDGVLVLATPGTGFDADRALDTLARLALAVAADTDRWTVRLRIGDARRG